MAPTAMAARQAAAMATLPAHTAALLPVDTLPAAPTAALAMEPAALVTAPAATAVAAHMEAPTVEPAVLPMAAREHMAPMVAPVHTVLHRLVLWVPVVLLAALAMVLVVTSNSVVVCAATTVDSNMSRRCVETSSKERAREESNANSGKQPGAIDHRMNPKDRCTLFPCALSHPLVLYVVCALVFVFCVGYCLCV